MIGYMDTTDVSTTVYRVGRTMASLFQFRLPSSVSHAGLCVITGMSPLGKVYFDASVPFAVAIALIIVLGLIALRKRGRDTTSAVSDESWSERTPLFQRELSGYGDVSTSFMSSQPARVVTGQARVFAILTSAGIMLYSAVNSAVLQMLHCVPLPGVDAGTTRLFLQASVACDYTGWQLPFIILLVCLVCVPILLGLCAQRAMSDVESPWWSGARLALTLPYTDRWCAWESVLMSHRLLLAIVFAFGPGYPVLQTTAASLICLLFLLGHVGCGAVSHTPSQVLQTCLLTLLCIAALARTFHAARTQLAIFADDSVTTSVLEAVTALSTLVLPLVCFLLSYARPCRRQLPT